LLFNRNLQMKIRINKFITNAINPITVVIIVTISKKLVSFMVEVVLLCGVAVVSMVVLDNPLVI